MKLCASCLICHPRDHFSNRQWKTHKSICSTCVDDKQTRKICGVTPPKLEASVAEDDDDEDDLLQARFPHMQPMISTAVVGLGDRTNGGTNKELQDADTMFPGCFTAASDYSNTNKDIEALLANTTHKLINEFEYIDFFENDYISSIVEHFGGDSKLVEYKLREDVDRMMALMH